MLRPCLRKRCAVPVSCRQLQRGSKSDSTLFAIARPRRKSGMPSDAAARYGIDGWTASPANPSNLTFVFQSPPVEGRLCGGKVSWTCVCNGATRGGCDLSEQSFGLPLPWTSASRISLEVEIPAKKGQSRASASCCRKYRGRYCSGQQCFSPSAARLDLWRPRLGGRRPHSGPAAQLGCGELKARTIGGARQQVIDE